jgi:hypothetical protein
MASVEFGATVITGIFIGRNGSVARGTVDCLIGAGFQCIFLAEIFSCKALLSKLLCSAINSQRVSRVKVSSFIFFL